MSVVKFELKQEHVKLLKYLKWGITENKYVISCEDMSDDLSPFGSDNIYEDIDLILNGKPNEFDPLNSTGIQYTEEQKKEWDVLMSELPTALDIILYNGNFELGYYKTKFHDRQWKKIN